MKLKPQLVLALILGFASSSALTKPAMGQQNFTQLPHQQKQHVLVNVHANSSNHIETLSGIHLYPAEKGTYRLRFEQDLKENGVLEISNTAGSQVYVKPVSISSNKKVWSYNLGKLRPDTYLIEIKTSDTTYWTKFKVGK
ncbi:hypothetical protein ACXYMU_07425 [Pontibacter sp. CAU 1760]